MMRDTPAAQASILSYWRAIELFEPQSIPAVAPSDKTIPVFRVATGDLPPWHPRHVLQKRPPARADAVWRHTLFAGTYSTAKVSEALQNAFGKDPESFDERSDGYTALFALSLTNDGRPLWDSLTVSSCAWGIGRLPRAHEDKDWSRGFESATSALRTKLEMMFAIPDEDNVRKELPENISIGRALSSDDMRLAIEIVATALHVGDSLGGLKECRVQSFSVNKKRAFDTDDTDFLNSFFLEDMQRVASAVEAGRTSVPLRCYLAADERTDLRQDVRKDAEVRFSLLEPAYFPPAKWPARDHMPLVLAQQLAINTLYADLGSKEGLFSINGPPGTGKTTLLRDLIAAVISDRAESMAKFQSPRDAILRTAMWKSNGYTRSIAIWHPSLHGHGIVAASSNNGAVENICLEIPAAENIEGSWLPDMPDHFAALSTRLLNGKRGWGLIAARLGNKSHRNQFLSQFWSWTSASADTSDIPRDEMHFDQRLAVLAEDELPWEEAVKQYRSARKIESDCRGRLQSIFDAMQSIPVILSTLQATTEHLERNDEYLVAAGAALLRDELQVRATADTLTTLEKQHDWQRRNRPDLLDILMTLGRAYREWRGKLQSLADQVEEFSHLHSACVASVGRSRLQHQDLVGQREIIIRDIARHHAEIDRLSAYVDAAREERGRSIPDIDRLCERDTEKTAPWSDPGWDEARVKVFFAALAVHRSFMAALPSEMRGSLLGAMDILKGSAPVNLSSELAEAAWDALFMAVPVVSSTFASLSRMFTHLDHRSLGWLLIDEAGQGTPQAAAGALWRARRAVVVGDPMQLEPVIKIPFTAQQSLRKCFGVAETWLPTGNSVQRLADRVNPWGTLMPGHNGDQDIWLGAPLVVHRRCDELQFTIANQIAYGGMMVFGTVGRDALALRESAWIDVPALDGEDHWIPADEPALRALLIHLLEEGVPTKEIALISPFRSVKNHLARIGREIAEGSTVGTIHTMQGKESDVVILVLGGHPSRPGAKTWAGGKPNLLNVAVTRPKRRLYVIGDHIEWRDKGCFALAAKVLPLHEHD